MKKSAIARRLPPKKRRIAQHPKIRRPLIGLHCEPVRKKLVTTTVFNLGFLLLAFRPLPQDLVGASQARPQPLPETKTVRVQASVAHHAQTSLQQVDRIWASTQAQIELDRNPPITSHSPPTEFQGQTVYQVPLPEQDRVVALTFDDGPWTNTAQILDILRKHDVSATFFVVGSHATERMALLRRIVAEGHELGNHSWNHRYHNVSPAEAVQEIDRTSEFIYQTTGVRTRFFRPPGGNLTNGLAAHAADRDYAVMMWSLDSLDYAVSVNEIVNNVLSQIQPGAVILLHDGGGDRSRTATALPEILKRLQEQGYRFSTLSELMELSVSRTQKGVEAPK
ncbi:MAG: polysaccharide deacetylase family protein [Cyanobacteria bacterium SID2]|nr:polysaccharide deacetylase family protein [Cyanobacteria bacterium SID2]MBP0006611.1 polysaccharide deacetylase family protein [Cyanobacteria bacterium SBC]